MIIIFTWDIFWDYIKVWFVLVGVALTAFLSIGAIYLAWWINDGFGLIMTICIILLLIAGGGAILTEDRNEK